MKCFHWLIMSFLCGSLLGPIEGYAVSESGLADGVVEVVGSKRTSVVDPENPIEVVSPGESPFTEGDLRIDFISSLNFDKAKLSKENRTYSVLAQQFFSETGPRGSYIQITDQRAQATGWSIQVKQNYQFRNPIIQGATEQELHGAILSLDRGWSNSSSESKAPTVTRETIALTAMNTFYDVAVAKDDGGQGVWTIAFGASDSNKNHQASTLAAIKDEGGEIVTDTTYGKPAYENSAITLTIPEATKIYPVEYETTLTWLLGELP